MMIDWVDEINKMAAAKRLLKAADADNLWREGVPSAPASPEELEAVKERLGGRLDAEYSSFLLHADGWPAILQETDLFGVSDLLGPRFDEARELLTYLEPEVIAAERLDLDSMVPIGASVTGIDVIVLSSERGGDSFPVMWIAGGEIERYGSFLEFFRGAIQLNIDEANDLLDAG